MTNAEIRYTTSDGVEHCETVVIAAHPILSVDSIYVEGVGRIPMENVRVFEEED